MDVVVGTRGGREWDVCSGAAIEKDKAAAVSHFFTLYSFFSSKHCSLTSSNIGDEGATALAEALKHNSTLTYPECDDEMRMMGMKMMGCVWMVVVVVSGGGRVCVGLVGCLLKDGGVCWEKNEVAVVTRFTLFPSSPSKTRQPV